MYVGPQLLGQGQPVSIANGTALRIAGAHSPSMKSVEEFDSDFQPSLWDGKTLLGIAFVIKTCQQGYHTFFIRLLVMCND